MEPSEFIDLSPEDVIWAATNLPQSLREAMTKRPNKCVVAGGFLRACIAGERKSDIDVFCPNVDGAESLVAELSEGMRIVKTDNATTLLGAGIPIQVIHKWTYEDAAAVLGSFDFTIATAGIWYDGSGWRGMAHALFYQDLAAKRLRYTLKGVPGGSLLRVLKFAARGYKIDPYNLARLIACVTHEAYRESDEEFEQDWRAVYASLRQVDPLTVPEGNAGDDTDPFMDA